MPRQGFYAIQNSEIRFGRDGRWYADGEPITNRRIADLFSRHVERRPDGGYQLRIGDERAPILVDDTPYVVTGVTVTADGTLLLELNDGSREPLDATTLTCGRDEALRCRVKAGSEAARFLRPAQVQIAERIEADPAGGFALRLGGRRYPIARE